MEANEVITNLNPLEYDIYFYLIQNKDMIISMKLKDLASQLHVSTAMITRVCQKLGFEGFGEYKAYLKLEEHEQVNTNTFQLEHIFNENNLTSKELQLLLCYALFPKSCLLYYHEDSLIQKSKRLMKYNKKLHSLILLLQKYIQIPLLNWIK